MIWTQKSPTKRSGLELLSLKNLISVTIERRVTGHHRVQLIRRQPRDLRLRLAPSRSIEKLPENPLLLPNKPLRITTQAVNQLAAMIKYLRMIWVIALRKFTKCNIFRECIWKIKFLRQLEAGWPFKIAGEVWRLGNV
jgi:hypothetical protein